MADQGVGFCGLERVDQGKRHHGNGRRMRRAAERAPRSRNAEADLRSLQVRNAADRDHRARDNSPAQSLIRKVADFLDRIMPWGKKTRFPAWSAGKIGLPSCSFLMLLSRQRTTDAGRRNALAHERAQGWHAVHARMR